MSSLLVRNVRLVPVTPPELGGRHTASAAGELDSGQTVAAHAGSEPVDVRVVDGVVTQVGPGLADDGSPVLEGEGRWAIPGLWDQHVHSAQAGLMARRLDVSGTAGPEEVTARVAEHVRSLDERPDADRTSVVSAWGHRSATWSRPATVAELDAVSGDHPVLIVSGDGHNGWLNSLALQRLGAPATRHALDEDDWFPVFGRLSELTGDDDVEGAVADLVADANARGVVGIVDFEFGAGYARWPERVAAGLDTLRVRPAVYPELLDAVLEAGLRTGQDLAAGLVAMGPLKIISDGSLNTRTAYCCEPYVDAGSLEFPRGKVNFPLDRLTSLLSTAHGAGLEIALHAIGDAAVEQALAAFEATGARGAIEHAQLVTWSDVPRMARLGVRASVQPAHLLDDRDVTDVCWGDRSERCFVLRSFIDAGVTLRMGSDAPVSPLDPWLAMAAAVHRSADERSAWHPEQAITPAEALGASTDGQGTIGVGSHGDVVLLDADPLASGRGAVEAAATLRDMRVAATVVAGRVVHDAR